MSCFKVAFSMRDSVWLVGRDCQLKFVSVDGDLQ